jgi:hypothetical protein
MFKAETQGEIIGDNGYYPVRPEDMDISTHLWDAFDNAETEISAKWLIRLAQQNGSWKPFTRDEIEEFYRSKSVYRGFSFNRLIDPQPAFYILRGSVLEGGGFIVEKEDKLHFTSEFVNKAFISGVRSGENRKLIDRPY